MGIIRFAMKSSLAGGLVYYTAQEGLWSSSEESVAFYGRLYNKVAPYIKDNIPKEVVNEIPELPSVTTMGKCARGTWNKGVKASIKYLTELPTHVSNGFDSIMSSPAIKNSIESMKNTPKEQPPTKTQ